jgi:ribosomal 30S subunit maturation factor RimM
LRVADAVAADAKKPEEILIPFVDQFVTTVDQLEKKITVDWERDY